MLIAVLTLLLAHASAAKATTSAADGAEIVVRDTQIRDIRALGGIVLYSRGGAGPDYRRVVDGERRRAARVPKKAYMSAVGRDAGGRMVVTMAVVKVRDHRVVDRRWWLYDVASDRARRLAVPGGKCAPEQVSVWRGRLAYASACPSDRLSGVFLRGPAGTRKVLDRSYVREPLYLRRGLLLAVLDDGVGSPSVWRVVAGGKACPLRLPGSYTSEEWFVYSVATRGRTVMWWVADGFGDDAGGLVGIRLNGCEDPGLPGPVPIAERPPASSRGRALDGRWLYTADEQALRRQHVPDDPETRPPVNDDVEDALPIGGDPPIALTTTIGNATTQNRDPTERTVWYRMTPTVSQLVAVRAGYFGFTTFVFEGHEIDDLKPVVTERTDLDLRFHAVAGRTYSIAVGCAPLGSDYEFECFIPFQLHVGVV